MLKFIQNNDDFLIDLSVYELNVVEENQWFSDQFFTKYTFPFELVLTDDLNADLGYIRDYNTANIATVYKGYLFVDNGHEEAVLEIVGIEGDILTVEISYGFDEFPNFDKQLAELPLEKKVVSGDLFAHATTHIQQTWPAVNYNFPRVHTDSFSPEDERWNGFEKMINNQVNGQFLLNEFEAATNTVYNRNIMIPMPYYLHVLKAGFQDAGYVLQGDVLEHEVLKKMCFFRETEEYVNARIEGDEYLSDIDSYDEKVQQTYHYGLWGVNSDTQELGEYSATYIFPHPGRYKVSGNVYMRRHYSDARAEITFAGYQRFEKYHDYIRQEGVSERPTFVDIEIDVDDINVPMRLNNRQIVFRSENEANFYTGPLWDLTITPLAIYDASGDLIPPTITTNKIDLTKCVPEVTFGEFVKMLKNTFNFDLKIRGNVVTMNHVEPQMILDDAIDFNRFNAEKPARKLAQSTSFLLKLKEIENDNYKPLPLFVDAAGAKTSGYSDTDDTNKIDINLVPFPMVLREGVTTALAVDKGESSMCAVLFSGASSNLSLSVRDLMPPQLYTAHFKKWLEFRIKAQAFTTTFTASMFDVRDVGIRSKIFMYNRIFLIKSMHKTNVPGKVYFQMEMELESLK